MIRLKEKIVSSILVTCILVSLFPITVYAQQTQESSLSENTIAMNVTNEEDGQVMVTEGVVNLGKTVAEVGKNTSSTSSAYASSWEYWSQGASKYSNGDNGLRESGCRIVAYSKALREAGFSNLANPDVFYEWGKAKDYYTGTSVYENASYGVPLITYAQENGGQCALIEKYTLTGNLSTDSAKIMGYINAGYYVILNSPTGYGFHTAYIGRQASIAQGKPVVLDSWSSKSSSANLVYIYTGKTSGSNVAYTACRAYKITPPSYVSSDTTPPTISNIRITDVSATGYTVSCDVTDNVGVKKVSFPTWTLDASSANEGQDDIAWGVGAKNGNTYTYRVNISEHNGELFDYETRIYAYDTSDNQAFATINGATNVSAVKSLVGTKVDLGASFDAYIKSLYNTYLTAEQNSNVDMKACSGNNNQKWHFERTSDGYYVITSKVDDKALDVESAGDVNETNIQVYAPNGLDNQKWGIYDDGSGNYVFIPKYSKKNVMDSSKSGEIGSNIYIFQYHGGPNQRFVVEKFTADTDPTPAETTPPVISNVRVTDVSAAGYTVSCDVTDNVGVKSVFFPSWTLDASSANEGQDDIVWGVGTKSGNTYTYRVNTSEHNSELFDYETRIYAYDINGNESYLFVQNVTNAEKMKNLIGTKSELGTSFDAYIKTEFETFLTAESDGNVVARLNNNTDNQKWHFERTSDGYYVITNKTNGKAIDVESMGDERTTNIQVYAPNGLDNQKWGIYDAGDGSYFLVPKYSKKNVMDSSESGVNGSNIYIFSYHGGQNQRFIISKYNDKYTITLKTSGSGTVSGSGTYDKNTGVTVIASPADGNSFKGWYNGTNLVSTDVRYKFNVNQNITLTAKFEKNTSNSDKVDSKQVEAFVSRMYTVALNREAEAAGLNDWSSQLAEQQIDGAGIANGFINSAEFTNQNLGNREFLDTLYETFFNRPADAGGKAYWMQQLSNGMSRTEVLSGFVNSQEFSNLCDNYGIARGTMQSNGSSIYRPGVRNYVLRMYTKALNRDGETVGVEDWTNRINTGTMSAENVAKSFFSSQEFINRNLSNSAYVETLYQTFMDRPSDASGKQYWINKLNSGMSREQVLEGFSRSAEFSEIMSRYGL